MLCLLSEVLVAKFPVDAPLQLSCLSILQPHPIEVQHQFIGLQHTGMRLGVTLNRLDQRNIKQQSERVTKWINR